MYNYAVVNKDAKRKKRKSLWRKIAWSVAVIIILGIALALWIYWKSMTPTILDVAVTRLKSETARVINEAVCLSITNDCNYADFVTIEKNANNDITMITANSSLVNTLARNTALLSQSKINELTSFDVNVPLGTLSGIPLLSEKGPKVNIVVTPVGTVNCTFTSTFETAGINQTLHRIYLNVESVVDLIIPTAHTEVATTTPVLLCESVIIGKVPDTFLQGGLLLGSS